MIVTFIWAVIIALGVLVYVILDGFDIGVGVILPFISKAENRKIMINSIIPFWDGNETWLVLGGVSLFTAFPLAYTTLLPALYVPLVLFIIALTFRGISFEFRFKATRLVGLWEMVFAISSISMAFFQGIILGHFIEGFKWSPDGSIQSLFQSFSPFTIFVACSLCAGYGLLGATWLIIKTGGDLCEWAYNMAAKLGMIVVAAIIAISLWTPLMHQDIADRWFSFPAILYLSPVPIITGLLIFGLYRSIKQRRSYQPFFYSVMLFVMSYIGLAISIWPYIVPRTITIWQAAAAYETRVFSLIGALVMLPVIVIYTYHSYKVFSGKVTSETKYY
jgi:cytochrome d ubiquinol oxidase subunit II